MAHGSLREDQTASKLTIEVVSSGQIFALDASPDWTLESLKHSMEYDIDIPTSRQSLSCNGHVVQNDSKTLQELQIVDDSMIRVLDTKHHQWTSKRRQDQSSTPAEDLRQAALWDPNTMDQLTRAGHGLAEVVHDPALFQRRHDEWRRGVEQEQKALQREMDKIKADELDPENQAKIAEMIRERNVTDNLLNALEEIPEGFGRVVMLYIDVEVNDCKVKAFVDSGAQTTILSPSCAERCNIMRLIDTRFSGKAYGVGSANIIGRVHAANIKIGSQFLSTNFTVMEGKDVDLLLGLDMLKRFQACIDLEKGHLRINGEDIPFLGEADIPKRNFEEPTIDGPGGLKIGGKSGTIIKDPSESQPSASSKRESDSSRLDSTAAQGHPPASHPNSSSSAITQLTEMGYTEGQAGRALELSGGVVETALDLLANEDIEI